MTKQLTPAPDTPPRLPFPAPKTDAPITLASALSELVREYLRTRNCSQRELARQLGLSQGAVSYLVGQKRRQAGWVYYERLAQQLFGLPLSVLCFDLEARVHDATTRATTARNLAVHRRPQQEGKPVVRVFEEVKGESPYVRSFGPSGGSAAEQEERLRKLGLYLQHLWSYYLALRQQTVADLTVRPSLDGLRAAERAERSGRAGGRVGRNGRGRPPAAAPPDVAPGDGPAPGDPAPQPRRRRRRADDV